MKKILLIIVVVFLALGCLGAIISSITDLTGGPTSDKPVYLTEKFTVSSSVQNVLLQTYHTTIKAKVVNNTNKEMTNVVFTIGLKTNTLNNTGVATINVASIPANSTKTIYEVISSNQNYETITSISYKATGILSTTIDNKVPTTNKTSIGIIIGCIILLIVLIIVAIILIKKKKKKQKYYTNNYQQVVSSNNNEVEMQRLEIEKEELKAKQELAKLERAKVEAESKKASIEKDALVTCQYCGKKIKKNISECPFCGGTANE